MRARGEPPNWGSIPPEMPNWHSRVVAEMGARGEPPNRGSILPKCPIGTPEWSRRREREENPPIGDPSSQNAQLALPSGCGDGSERRTPQSGTHPPKMPNWHSRVVAEMGARGEPPSRGSIPPEMPNWHSQVVAKSRARGEPPNWGSIHPEMPNWHTRVVVETRARGEHPNQVSIPLKMTNRHSQISVVKAISVIYINIKYSPCIYL